MEIPIWLVQLQSRIFSEIQNYTRTTWVGWKNSCDENVFSACALTRHQPIESVQEFASLGKFSRAGWRRWSNGMVESGWWMGMGHRRYTAIRRSFLGWPWGWTLGGWMHNEHSPTVVYWIHAIALLSIHGICDGPISPQNGMHQCTLARFHWGKAVSRWCQ